MELDALDRVEAMIAGDRFFTDIRFRRADVQSVVRECRAARKATGILGEEHDHEIKAWNDALRMVAEKMKEARHGK